MGVCVSELEANDIKSDRLYIVGMFERGHQVPAEVAVPDARRDPYAMAPCSACTGQRGEGLRFPVQHLR
jgi:hypothetical protein